jgi:hypothetical protein
MLPKLTTEHSTMTTFLLPNYFPSPFEIVWSAAAGCKRHFQSIDRAVNAICCGVGKAEATGINLVQVGEDLKLELCR